MEERQPRENGAESQRVKSRGKHPCKFWLGTMINKFCFFTSVGEIKVLRTETFQSCPTPQTQNQSQAEAVLLHRKGSSIIWVEDTSERIFFLFY